MLHQETVCLRSDYGSLGDQLCFIGAARHYARAHSEFSVVVPNLPDLVGAYADDLIAHGNEGRSILCNPELRHRAKHESRDMNYLGTYMAELGLPTDIPPALELPSLPPVDGLLPGAYVCLQPYSGFSGVPKDKDAFFEFLVKTVVSLCPNWPIVAVGLPDTPRDIRGVSYDYLGDHITFLKAIQHAAMVLTPRSASAHIAAAHGVPTFVWVPPDGEEWHLDYPGWPHYRMEMNVAVDVFKPLLEEFTRKVRSGSLTSARPLKQALERHGCPNLAWFAGVGAKQPRGLADIRSCRSPAESLIFLINDRADGISRDRHDGTDQVEPLELISEDAELLCRGTGVDIGDSRKSLRGAIPIRSRYRENPAALDCVKRDSLDFIFSAHFLHQLTDIERTLRVWNTKLKPGGVLFLYLPHPDAPASARAYDPNLRHLSPESARKASEQAGFRTMIATELPDPFWNYRYLGLKTAS